MSFDNLRQRFSQIPAQANKIFTRMCRPALFLPLGNQEATFVPVAERNNHSRGQILFCCFALIFLSCNECVVSRVTLHFLYPLFPATVAVAELALANAILGRDENQLLRDVFYTQAPLLAYKHTIHPISARSLITCTLPYANSLSHACASLFCDSLLWVCPKCDYTFWLKVASWR